MRHRDNPVFWAKCGQIVFVGILVYWLWDYIIFICTLFGAYSLWRLWNDGNRS